MKKTLLVLMIVLLSSIMLITLTGCNTGSDEYSIKYCEVSGCPQESLLGEDYCTKHKCWNGSCSNKSIEDYSYCRECFERAE